jgi:hypothetical protein
VSSAVQDVTGDSIPDLLVSNTQSNNVFVLPGVGGGFFNDQNPLVFDTGASPRQAIVGNFDGRPGLDLIAVDAGADSLTFFSDFTAPDAVGISIASGGLTPVAALTGDFNGDGLGDLVVANNGDGALSLFLGREDGLSLEGLRFLADLPHPTALAFAGVEGTELQIYVAGEGAEAVRLLTFSPDLGPLPLPRLEPLPFPGSGRGQVAELLPLQDTTLAAVAVLLTVRLEGESLPARLEQEFAAASRGDDSGAFARLLPDRAAEQPGGEEEAASLDADGPVDLPAARDALLDLVTGREEERASRPPITREDVLHPTRPAPDVTTPAFRQQLDESMPGTGATLDAFWESVANGGPSTVGNVACGTRHGDRASAGGAAAA